MSVWVHHHIQGKKLKICFKNAIDYFDLMVCTSSETVSAASPSLLSNILTPGTPHTWQCSGDMLALPAMGWMIPFVMSRDGTPSHPGRKDLGWVLSEDRQSQDLLKYWSWIPFDQTCGVSHHGRNCGDLRCWPALLVTSLLIYLVHPSCG